LLRVAPPQGAVLAPTNEPFGSLIARFETEYDDQGRHRRRAHNVELAAEKMDGALMQPGEELSFNEVVGPRTRRAGFRKAPVIVDGQLKDGMGGGICQVATTLFAAVLHGGLEVVEAQPHSRPSHYVPLGMDATVTWPQRDLRVRNPFDFPIRVDVDADGGQLEVAIWGQETDVEVEIERRVVARLPFGERIVEDPTLPVGERVTKQRGIRGARVRRTRHVRRGDEVVVEREMVRYPPTDRIVRVGVAKPVLPPASVASASARSDGPIGPLALR
jgi:vancomycin resistance protein YoaR